MVELTKTENDSNTVGTIFDIKRFATGDGPGIRTLVFLKGCPLKCKWCANPESQRYEPEIIYYKNKCKGCGRCINNCPESAIKIDKKFGLIVDMKKCSACGKCEEGCYYDARELIGENMTVSTVLGIILKDKKYYDNSNGGVTLTGGEPLFQYKFTREVLKACKKYKIHTAIETSGFAEWEHFMTLLPYINLIFYDFKHIDPHLHLKYTGVSNELIVENLRKLNDEFNGDIIVRIPFITDHNSSIETQKQMYMFIKQFKKVKRIEIMPYHRLGTTKYYGLGRDYELDYMKMVNKKDLNYLVDLGKSCEVEVHIDSK